MAGRAEIMDMVAPVGPMYQAGTLSGNPLAMAAGYATLRYLRDHKEIYATAGASLAGSLLAGVAAAAKDAGVPITTTAWDRCSPGSSCRPGHGLGLRRAKSDTEAFGQFFRAMLEAGVYLPPSQFEAAFLSAAHTEDDVQQTIAAAKKAFAMAHA